MMDEGRFGYEVETTVSVIVTTRGDTPEEAEEYARRLVHFAEDKALVIEVNSPDLKGVLYCQPDDRENRRYCVIDGLTGDILRNGRR